MAVLTNKLTASRMIGGPKNRIAELQAPKPLRHQGHTGRNPTETTKQSLQTLSQYFFKRVY